MARSLAPRRDWTAVMRAAAVTLVLLLAVGAQRAEAVGLFPAGTTGYDVSWPSCNLAPPAGPFSFLVIGATGGRAFTHNPCLAAEAAWAARTGIAPALYINMKSP